MGLSARLLFLSVSLKTTLLYFHKAKLINCLLVFGDGEGKENNIGNHRSVLTYMIINNFLSSFILVSSSVESQQQH